MQNINIKYNNKRTTTLISGNIPCIKYDIYKNCNITDAFSTRLGGVSSGQFTSMNFCTTLGDSKENVLKNFSIFGEATGLNNFVLSKQTHTTNVIKVSETDVNKGLHKEMDYDNVDGLVTNVKGITLSTFYADCVPLYFYDPVNSAIGLSHAGWKGTVNNIVKSTVDKMSLEYGTNAKDLICAIGPSICVNCYEVSYDVASAFIDKYNISNIPDYNYTDAQNMDFIIFKTKKDKFMLNLWAANYTNMKNIGIMDTNISIPDICTCENKDILFSHRGLNGKRGNLGAFLRLDS